MSRENTKYPGNLGDMFRESIVSGWQVCFDSFSEVEAALGELRTHQYHTLRVYNSQTATDYNKKRLSAENPVEPVDTDRSVSIER